MSECYEISLKFLPGTDPRGYVFREDHGGWDEGTKTFVHRVTTINTAEEGITLEEAEDMYTKARSSRARSGFVHSFAPDYSGEKPYEYQLLE